MNTKALVEHVHGYLLARFPDMRVVEKSESRFMRAIGWVLGKVGMSDFMDNYTTTIGQTVYSHDISWMTLAHEGIHIIDDSRHRVWFKLKYLFPQVLVVLALAAIGAVFSLWMLTALAFLLALAPWPSPGRVAAERRGYKMTALCNYLASGEWVHSEDYVNNILHHFTKSDYYFMSWRKDHMRSLLLADIESAIRIAKGQEIDPDYGWILPIFQAYSK